MLVFSMGIVLLGGTVLVAGLVWKKMSALRNADMLSASECPGGAVDLKGRGIIIESQIEEQLLRLTLERHPGNSEIVTIDTCTGQVIGTLKFETDPGMGTAQ